VPEKEVYTFDTSKEERPNVIQIVLENSTMMFDLDEEKEIAILNDYSQLFGHDSFVQTGFKIV